MKRRVAAPSEAEERAVEPSADRVAAVVLIAYVRWAGVLLGILQALLVTDPRPVGGATYVLLATAVMAAYNVPATLARRFTPRTVERLCLGCLVGDFVVCTAWTMLAADDIYSTTYAIYVLVGIEAAYLYRTRGALVFAGGFVLAYVLLYWERATFFRFPVLISSLIFRSGIVLIAVAFAGAIAEQSDRRRVLALQASAEARRQAEAAHRGTEQLASLLRAISDMGEGVVTVVGGRIVGANEAFCRLTGYAVSELSALGSVLDVVAPRARDALRELEPETAFDGASGESAVLTSSGEEIPVDWATRQVQTATAAQLVVVVRDARDRKRILQLLEAERDRAGEASKAKSEYLSRMSHELRTPLTAIVGFAELLELEDREEDRGAVGSILRASGHLLSLINDALDISRIESGKESMSLEPVSVDDVIDECVRLMRPLAESHFVSLRREPVEAGAAYVHADAQRLKQVLLNLLSNGVKYSGREASLTIGARLCDSERIRLAVTDNGPGIPKDLVPVVFDPFERLGAERAGPAGTGLGLALAKRAVEAMGGTVGVDSAPGKGSTFWVDLRPAGAPAPAAAPEAPQPRRAGPVPEAAADVVLYVEDNATTVSLVERIFALRPSIKLLTAMQGSLALDLAREHHPSLVILDLHLPDIDGDEVLRRLKQDERTRDIDVVILSADATKRQLDRLLVAGAAHYLTKPVRVTTLLDVVDSTLAGRQAS